MFRLKSLALVVLSSSAFLAACGGEDTPTTPTPAPQPIVVVFSGEINRNGAMTHTFDAGASGDVIATLDTVGPETVGSIGLSLGSWNATFGTCQTIISNDNAVQGTRVVGAATQASSLCVRVYDVGKISALASYQVTVSHP